MIYLFAIGSGFSALMFTVLYNWLLARKWRNAREEHWTERARLLYPARIGAFWNFILLPALAMAAVRFIWPSGEISSGDSYIIIFLTWLGVLVGTRPLAVEIMPELSVRYWAQETFSTWLMLGFRVGTYFLMIGWMPGDFGLETASYFALFLTLQLLLNWKGNILLLKALRVIHPATPELQALVDRVATRMNCRVKGVWLWETSSLNALAFPVTGDLLFSKRLLAELTEEEVESVCAHELGHLMESTPVVLTRLSSVVGTSLLTLIFPAVNTFGIFGMLGLYGLWFAIQQLSRKVARAMEVRADGIAHTDQGGEIYARALEKLYRLNQMPAVMPGKKMIHPHLYDRMVSAGITPDYPRPAAPSAMPAMSVLMLALVLVLFITMIRVP